MSSNTNIILDGLILYLDLGNEDCFAGETTTNLLTNAYKNSIFDTGNDWGTYNTNNYNSNVDYNIGTILSVTDNIATFDTDGERAIRTYDVLNAGSSGGGVTAGTEYLIQKHSANSFSIHAYNASQDGSQGGFNINTGYPIVWDAIATDTRVPISLSGFPNMWHGNAHRPNSGLVKEIRYGEGALSGNAIRLHTLRTDGVRDGMAYGAVFPITEGLEYTVSFWYRTLNTAALGKTCNYIVYQSSAGGYTYGPQLIFDRLNEWKKYTHTWVATATYSNCASYWFQSTTTTYPYHFDISNFQVEQKDHATKFTIDPRTTTSVNNLVGSDEFTIVGNPAFGDDYMYVNDVNTKYLNAVTPTNYDHSTDNFTLTFWLKEHDSNACALLEARGTDLIGYLAFINRSEGSMDLFVNASGGQSIYAISGLYPNSRVPTEVSFVVDRKNTNIKYYVNGELKGTKTGIHSTTIQPVSGQMYRIGYDRGGNSSNANYYAHLHYDRALSDIEVKQNYNALKNRFK